MKTDQATAPRFERLVAWQATYALALGIYRITAQWPSHERYGLTAQIRRASVSSAVNLAEGAARLGKKEFARFVDIAHGSLAEVQCLLRFGRDLGYIDERTWSAASAAAGKAGACVWGLLRGLRRELHQASH